MPQWPQNDVRISNPLNLRMTVTRRPGSIVACQVWTLRLNTSFVPTHRLLVLRSSALVMVWVA